MANTNADVIRVELATEASAAATLKPKMRAHAKDTRRLVWMEADNTLRYAWDSTRVADQTGTYGTAIMGSAGITGITPNGGSSGAAATLANMLTGIRDSVILKSPYNSTINTIQPTADYIPLTIKGFAAGVQNLLNLQTSAATVGWFDNKANLTLSRGDAGNDVSIRIINSDNTSPASNAKILLSTGGSSAGDPFVNYSISGGQQFSEGIDRSDGYKYKISESATLGTNDALIIASGGAITLNRAVSAGFTLGVTGAVSFASYLEFTTSGSGGAGRIWKSSTTGLTIEGVAGSSYDLTLLNPSAQALLRNPTGTQNLEVVSNLNILGTLSVTGTSSLTGNLTLSRSAVGGTVLATISNTDNTNPASDVGLLIHTGGSTAGSAYTNYVINGVSNSWFTGVINLGGSSVFDICYGSGLGSGVALSIDNSLKVTVLNAFGVTGVATFTAAPIFSSVTASQILSVNGSKALTSVATTGSGSVMLAASPTTTGTLTAAIINASGLLTASGKIDVNLANPSVDGIRIIATTTTNGAAMTFNSNSANSYVGRDNSVGNNIQSTSFVPYALCVWNADDNPILFGTNNVVRMKIDSSTIAITDALTVSGDLTVSRSSSSTPVQTTISNTSSSAGADARLLIAVTSTSANPFLTYSTNGSTFWSSGPDNTDSGNFKISKSSVLGTNDALKIEATGLRMLTGGSLVVAAGNGNYLRLPRGTSIPASPIGGELYHNTADGHFYWYSGSAWVILA